MLRPILTVGAQPIAPARHEWLNSATGEPLADQIELIERAVPDRYRARAWVSIGVDSNR